MCSRGLGRLLGHGLGFGGFGRFPCPGLERRGSGGFLGLCLGSRGLGRFLRPHLSGRFFLGPGLGGCRFFGPCLCGRGLGRFLRPDLRSRGSCGLLGPCLFGGGFGRLLGLRLGGRNLVGPRPRGGGLLGLGLGNGRLGRRGHRRTGSCRLRPLVRGQLLVDVLPRPETTEQIGRVGRGHRGVVGRGRVRGWGGRWQLDVGLCRGRGLVQRLDRDVVDRRRLDRSGDRLQAGRSIDGFKERAWALASQLLLGHEIRRRPCHRLWLWPGHRLRRRRGLSRLVMPVAVVEADRLVIGEGDRAPRPDVGEGRGQDLVTEVRGTGQAASVRLVPAVAARVLAAAHAEVERLVERVELLRGLLAIGLVARGRHGLVHRGVVRQDEVLETARHHLEALEPGPSRVRGFERIPRAAAFAE